MLVRIVLFLGVSLILFAGGAAGWQYWQSLPAAQATADTTPAEDAPAEEVAATAAPRLDMVGQIEATSAPSQNWLISPGGGLVDRYAVQSWLRQDRFVEERVARVSLIAPLSALLDEGQALPAPVYRQVFADIRAKALATTICAPMVTGFAAACAVKSANVREGSLDEAGETARFDLELVYTHKADPEPMPDLSTRVLNKDWVRFDGEDAGAEVTASPEAYLAHAVAAALAACPTTGAQCRVTSLHVDWQGPGQASGGAEIGWLTPLPKGMYAAPPLTAPPPPEG